MTDELTSKERIAYYRKQAKEARTMAAKAKDAKAHDVLMEVAATWERLAELEPKIIRAPKP